MTLKDLLRFSKVSGLRVYVEAAGESVSVEDGVVVGQGTGMGLDMSAPADVLMRAEFFRLSATDATEVVIERPVFERVMSLLEQGPDMARWRFSLPDRPHGRVLSSEDGARTRPPFAIGEHLFERWAFVDRVDGVPVYIARAVDDPDFYALGLVQ